MKYISIAIHNNELVLISGMEEFASHFCYSSKQRQGLAELAPCPAAVIDDAVIDDIYIDEGME